MATPNVTDSEIDAAARVLHTAYWGAENREVFREWARRAVLAAKIADVRADRSAPVDTEDVVRALGSDIETAARTLFEIRSKDLPWRDLGATEAHWCILFFLNLGWWQ